MIATISRRVLAEIRDHVASEPKAEVCGLLMGRGGDIDRIVKATNVAQDRSNSFEIDPVVLIAEHKAARGKDYAIIGHYHSHPGGDACPSARDAAAVSGPGLWIIVSGERVMTFVASDHGTIHGKFSPCELYVR